MKDSDDQAIVRVNPLKLLTDENYSKNFPEDKSSAEEPFIFNMDNVQMHVIEDSLLLTGETIKRANVYKIDLTQGIERINLTNKITMPCNYVG